MIPKVQILDLARHYELRPTTVEKDYVIGWLLTAISNHDVISQWLFKGGTCLKKCYFETYRFSEDLDFTIPSDHPISEAFVYSHLDEAATWIESRTGLTFPRQDWKIERYTNPRGNDSYQMKICFSGPLALPAKSLQRIKLDLTQDELIAARPQLGNLHHGYSDSSTPPPGILCYSINEILAEKTRALVERRGRARDVYDVVNISRNFREEIDPKSTKDIAGRKFEFKGLPKPSVAYIMDSLDIAVLRANWDQQLAHQVNKLAPLDTFLEDLKDAIEWWLEPLSARPALDPMPEATGNSAPRQLFPTFDWKNGPTVIDQIRYAARNNLCATISYHGSPRLVEPYSLRYPLTGNQILHVWEREKNGIPSNSNKSFKTHEIESASVSRIAFVPKWLVEL